MEHAECIINYCWTTLLLLTLCQSEFSIQKIRYNSQDLGEFSLKPTAAFPQGN